MATTKKAKCSEPASASARLGSGEDTPVCAKHLDELRARAANAGKKPLPKGATKAQTAAIIGTNRDDVLPVQVRGLTAFERESEVGCFIHLVGEE